MKHLNQPNKTNIVLCKKEDIRYKICFIGLVIFIVATILLIVWQLFASANWYKV
jgi:hypothetical protein